MTLQASAYLLIGVARKDGSWMSAAGRMIWRFFMVSGVHGILVNQKFGGVVRRFPESVKFFATELRCGESVIAVGVAGMRFGLRQKRQWWAKLIV